MESLIISNNSNNPARPCANHEIRLDLTCSLQMENMQVAMSYLGIYYSWRNVTAALGNNLFKYQWIDGVVYTVLIQDGFYQINQLSDYMHLQMYKNHHYMLDSLGDPAYFITFTSNANYYCVSVDCFPVLVPANGSNPWLISTNLGQVPQIIFLNNYLDVTLGITAGSYPPTAGTLAIFSFNSQSVPQISNITTIYVASNVVGSLMNQYRNVFYQFAPNVAYGNYFEKEPYQPIFFRVEDGTYNSVSLFFYDQNYQPIPIIDRNICSTLIFEKRK